MRVSPRYKADGNVLGEGLSGSRCIKHFWECNSPDAGFEGQGLNARFPRSCPGDPELRSLWTVLHIEEFTGANLGMYSQQHGAAQAHIFDPHDLRERACHPVHPPDAHREFNPEPRLSAPVHAFSESNADHRPSGLAAKDRVGYFPVITGGDLNGGLERITRGGIPSQIKEALDCPGPGRGRQPLHVCVRTGLTPLRGCVIFHLHPRFAPWAGILRRYAAHSHGPCSTASSQIEFSTHYRPEA